MSDLINRQDAIDALDEDIMGGLNYRRILQSLPSADKPTRWILVSERLPEKNGCYLVSTTGENNYIIDIAFYIEGMWHKTSRIKAWMPLPEPYEEEVSSMNRDYMTIDRLVAMVDALIRKEELCEGRRIDGDHSMSCSKCRELAADRIIEILQGE